MRDYDLHATNYVMQHFRHLMTDVERAADDAIVLTELHSSGGDLSVTLKPGTPSSLAPQVHEALKDGVQIFRRRTRERILAAHPKEVTANACPKCGRFPATPRAKMCFWCAHTWRESQNA
jgi:hypothetical protein